jgi:hypothetical protein
MVGDIERNQQPEHSSSEDQEKWAKDDRDDFAELRSHDASKIAYDFQKVTAQSCLLINGGAATAVLALLAKDKIDPALLKTVPWCLALYAVGVAASAVMMFCAMMLAEKWNYFWYHFAYTADEARGRANEKKAGGWQKMVRASFVSAMLCFLAASLILATALAYQK